MGNCLLLQSLRCSRLRSVSSSVFQPRRVVLPQFSKIHLDPTQKLMTMTTRVFIAVAVFVAAVAAQEEFQCPLESGFFAHDTSCDRYWHCQDDVAELKLCANGLAFDDTDPRNQRENCDYIYNVECGDRTEIEAAISTPHCERLNGVSPMRRDATSSGAAGAERPV